MSADVISYRTSRRKHANAWSWTMRRTGMLIVTVAALLTATWLATQFQRPAPVPAASAPQTPEPMLRPIPPAVTGVETSPIMTAPAAPRRRRVALRPAGVPLDGRGEAEPAGYEILSAAELAAISQARE